MQKTIDFEKYNLTPFNEYRYLTINVDKKISNINFDEILLAIGKYYYNMDGASINMICSLIKDDINACFHLNRLRAKYYRNRVSVKQIKSIRRSFIKYYNTGQNFIRVPFNIVPILFYILHIFDTIDNAYVADIKYKLNKYIIGDYIYKDHWGKSKNYIRNNEYELTHHENMYLRSRYNYLIAQLMNSESMLNQKYDDVNWSNLKHHNYSFLL